MNAEQEWEKLRREVASMQGMQLTTASETQSVERRVSNLERRQNMLEVTHAKEWAALSTAFSQVAKSLDLLVSRTEFHPVRLIAYFSGGLLLLFAVISMFLRMLSK